MGHERPTTLPRSVSWRQIVGKLEEATAGSDIPIASVAAATVKQVRSRYELLHKDAGVQAAFGFLVAVARGAPPTRSSRAAPDVPLLPDASPLRLAIALNAWVDAHAASQEYAELAKRAAAEALAVWHRQQSRQLQLFTPEHGPHLAPVWAAAATGAGFSEIARLFFASFTERYVKYFLEREASAVTPSVQRREELATQLHESLQLISRHAFETARMPQPFAAGWFTKNALPQTPRNGQLETFLRVAFEKLRAGLEEAAA